MRRACHAVPSAPSREEIRHEHQQRENADALGDHADTGGEASEPERAPVRPAQEVDEESPVGERDPAHDQRIDLRALDLVHELEHEQHRDRRVEPGLVVPESSSEIVGEAERQQTREQRRQQERDTPAARDFVGGRFAPHHHRRLVRIELAPALRKKPVARFDHLLGREREARLVARPRIAQADTGAEQHEREQHEKAERATLALPVDRQCRSHGDTRQKGRAYLSSPCCEAIRQGPWSHPRGQSRRNASAKTARLHRTRIKRPAHRRRYARHHRRQLAARKVRTVCNCGIRFFSSTASRSASRLTRLQHEVNRPNTVDR